MTRQETAIVLAVVRMAWPHSNLGPSETEIVAFWHSMLADCDRAEVEAAVKEMAASGREHAPPVGAIIKTIAEREVSAPDFDEVKQEILTAIRKYRPPRDVAMANPYACPPSEYWSHPLVGQFAEDVWNEWRMAPDPDSAEGPIAMAARTFHAQQRDAYQALRARARRDESLAAVGAQRDRELRRPDYAAALLEKSGKS